MTREERFLSLLRPDDVSRGIKQHSIRGGAIAITSEAVDFVLRVGSIAILARLLVPEHFGLLAMVTAITTIAERFKDLGLSAATVQRLEINHAQISTLFWVNAGIGLMLMTLVVLAAYPIALFYDEPRLFPITIAIALGLLWGGVSIQHQALLRRTMRFGALATIQVGSSAISIVLAIVAALLGFEYWSLVIREVARSVLVAIGSWAFMPWVPSRPTRQAGVADMLSFGGNLTGFYIVHFLSASLGQVLIGRLFGADALGFYRQGQALVLAPVEQLSGPVTSVGDAALCRLQNNAEKYRRYYRKLLLLMSSATLPLVAVLAIFAEEFVHVLLGADWAEAAPIFRILAIAVLLSPSVTTTTTVTTTCGFTRRLFWLGVANSVVLVAFFFIGIPWGPTGIALAHVWAFYLLLAPRVYWSLRATPVDINLFLTTIARPVIAAAIMSAVVLALKCAQLTPGPVVTLALGLPVAAFVYSIAWLLMPGGTQTLKQVWQDLSGPLHLDRFLPKSVRTRASSDPI